MTELTEAIIFGIAFIVIGWALITLIGRMP